jgi:hypothetical protein
VGEFWGLKAQESCAFPSDFGLRPALRLGIRDGWQDEQNKGGDSGMRIASLVFDRNQQYAAFSVIRKRGSLGSSGVQKNGLRLFPGRIARCRRILRGAARSARPACLSASAAPLCPELCAELAHDLSSPHDRSRTRRTLRSYQPICTRPHELARSVEELRALGEVSQAVNSTLDLETVLTTIVAKAVQLSNTDARVIYVLDELDETLRVRATYGLSDELVAAIRGQPAGASDALRRSIYGSPTPATA